MPQKRETKDTSRESVGRSNEMPLPHAAGVPSAGRKFDRWLSDKRPFVLALIVAISALARITYYVELSDGPLSVQHRWDQVDMFYFDRWARDIAAGDWLSRNISPPLQSWHCVVAEDCFRRHPGEVARLLPQATTRVDSFFREHPEAESILQETIPTHRPEFLTQHPQEVAVLRERIVTCGLLWDEWIGQRQFYQDPLYPYLIALTYKLAGPDVRGVFVWQMLLGVLSNVLIYLIARRYFGPTVGAVAGLLAALCPILLYFEMVLLRETLIIFTGLLMVWLAGGAAQRRRPGGWLLVGIVMGLSMTLKSHFILFAFGTLIVLAVQCRRSPKELMRLEASAIVGVLIGLAPLAARNIAVGVSPMTTASTGGVNFILGNPDEPGDDASSVRLERAAQILYQTQGRLLPTILATLKIHSNAVSYLKTLWNKFSATWHWYEIPDNTNFYYYRLHAAILRGLPVTFLVLSPLALMGLALGIRWIWNWSSIEPAERSWCTAPHLYLLVLTNLAVLLAFFVRDRFRAPLTAALIPFAALTVVTAMQWLHDRRNGRVAIIVTGVILLAFWTARPLPQNKPLIRPVDYFVPYQLYYDPLEQQARRSGDYLKAATLLADSLRFEPEMVRPLGPARRASSFPETAMGQYYADIHYRCAQDYHLAGREQEASRQRARAEALETACRPNAGTGQ